MDLSDLQYPVASQNIFSKIIGHDWYDGITSGLTTSQLFGSFRFDIITWGPCQETRIFALSRLADRDFNRIEELLSVHETPNWPVWFPKWPRSSANESELKDELNRLWSSAKAFEYAVAADSKFETLLAAKQLDQQDLNFLPSEFDGQPVSDKFNEWRIFLNLPE
jgi:hypothetical protein